MAPCPVCNKPTVRLANHLRKIHNLYLNTIEPRNIKEFIQLLQLIPITVKEMKILASHKKEIDRFLHSDESLPSNVFQVIYKHYDYYRSNHGKKLLILNGLKRISKSAFPISQNKLPILEDTSMEEQQS